MKNPLILNIQKYSLHDGDGIRTTIFFKGCPLECIWCH
ncbi:MAG: glycyl-radical enzyme activating protein, partial [Clostridiales bacterium]|nr:glycyl-radical enzyme activating protein [Clostridiales bacterium]